MSEDNKEIIAYKGFDKDLRCRDYQYKVGKTYEHSGEVNACESGFHACEYPLDVFGYYEPAGSRFAIVKMGGETSRETEAGDTKIASSRIVIEKEINLSEMAKRAVEWIESKVDWDNEVATNTECLSVATNTESRSVATNIGYRSASTNTGDWSVATNTGDRSASTNTGDQSVATNSGRQSAAVVEGLNSVAIAVGAQSKAKAAIGGAIICVYRDDDGNLTHIRASKVGENGVKPNVYYKLDEDGEFVEADELGL